MQPLPLPFVNGRQKKLVQYGKTTGTVIAFAQAEPTQHYLQLTAQTIEGTLLFYCSVNALLDAYSLSPVIFPRSLIEQGLLIDLVESYFSQHEIGEPFFNFPLKTIRCTGTIMGSEIKEELVSFANGHQLAWFSLSTLPMPSATKIAKPDRWQNLRLSMGLKIGETLLAGNEFLQLVVGDVLLIQRTRYVVRVGNDEIYQIEFEENTMTMEELAFSVAEHEGTLSVNGSEASGTSLANLSVTVAFFVGEKTMTLRQLQELSAGDLLPLLKEHQQHRSVYLKVNNQRVAEGELVLLDDQLAVEITRVQGAQAGN